MIELLVTYALGTLLGGTLIGVWMLRALWPDGPAPVHRET